MRKLTLLVVLVVRWDQNACIRQQIRGVLGVRRGGCGSWAVRWQDVSRVAPSGIGCVRCELEELPEGTIWLLVQSTVRTKAASEGRLDVQQRAAGYVLAISHSFAGTEVPGKTLID